jgi:hypothetical protein
LIQSLALVAGTAGWAAACAGDNGLTPPGPEFRGVEIQPNPRNTISARAAIDALLYDSAFVRYWRAGEAPRSSPRYAFDGGTEVVVPVLALDTVATYFIETNLILGDSVIAAVDTSEFVSGSLPNWIPATVPQGSDTTPGFLTLSYPDGPVIIDNTGKVVWYRFFPNGVLNSFQAHADGRFTVLGLGDTVNQFHVLDELGEETGTLSCVAYETRFHDLLVLADGSAWMLCDETRTMDLSSLGGVDTARVMGTVVQHLGVDGQVLFEWNSFDHFAITDLAAGERMGPNVNFTHGNGIALDIDGNLLLSFRSLNEVTKVNTATGNVMWRFGGLRNEFTLLNDPKGSFERQHGVRLSAPGQIQMLDNGTGAPSRFVRYLINPAARTALLIVQFIDTPTTFTAVGGATQYYGNGHALVTFGRAGRVIEVDEAGNRAWELTGIDGVYVFRAQRISSLYATERAAQLEP